MFTFKDENICQAEALMIISHMHPDQVTELISWHQSIIPVTFRKIINAFEAQCDRVPTADELIGISNMLLNENILAIDCTDQS